MLEKGVQGQGDWLIRGGEEAGHLNQEQHKSQVAPPGALCEEDTGSRLLDTSVNSLSKKSE